MPRPDLRKLIALIVFGVLLASSCLTILEMANRYWGNELSARDIGVLALMFVEISLGWQIQLNQKNTIIWVANSCLFAAFAAVSTFRWWGGFTSCGCFGEIVVPPQVIAIFDLLLAIACTLAAKRTNFHEIKWSVGLLQPAVIVICFSLFSLGIDCLGLRELVYGTPLTYIPKRQELTTNEVGVVSARVCIQNRGNSEIDLIGGMRTCSVNFGHCFPTKLRPWESIEIPLTIKVPKSSNQISVPLRIVTNFPKGGVYRFAMTARVFCSEH